MGITAILLAAVMLLFVPVSSAIGTNVVNNDVKLVNKTVNDYIERTLSFANRVDVFSYVDFDDVVRDDSANHNQDLLDVISSYCRKDGDISGEVGSLPGQGILSTVANDPNAVLNNPGLLIFHYDSTNHTYVLYDIPIKLMAKEISIVETASDATIQNAVSSFLQNESNFEKYRVFNEEFYGGYKYLFELGTSGTCMEVRISTYSKLNDAGDPFELKPLVEPTKALAADPTWVPIDDDPDCAPYFESLELNTFDCLNITRGSSIATIAGGGYTPTINGHDIVVVYNMHEFTIASLALDKFTSP